MRYLPVIFFTLFTWAAQAQLVINELSNGTSGAQEYVELVVVGTPGCNTPCIDLRGWILDDNNGTFASGSGTGIAMGHMIFANNAQWQCMNPGAIILIYNDDDRNPAIPADDPTDANGDCIYIIPANSLLFEHTTSNPVVNGSQGYSGPYTPGGNWSTQGMSNSNDSYQLRNPNNINVPYHSVSYGNNNTNTIIAFSGSGGNTVWYNENSFNNDPFEQLNWTPGTAGVDETPGAPNTPDNAAWISLMNNNCSPVGALPITAGPDTSICAGETVTLTATSDSTGTYTWSTTDVGSSITVSPLVTTVYYVTLDNGTCTGEDSVTVTVGQPSVGSISGNTNICAGESTTLTASGGTVFDWSTGDNTADITVSPISDSTYFVGVSNGNGCIDTVYVTVNVDTLPEPQITGSLSVCTGQSTTLDAGPGTSWLWSTGDVTQTITLSPAADSTVSVTVTNSFGCTGADTVTVLVGANLTPTITGNTSICAGDTTTLTVNGGTSWVWSTTEQTQSIDVSPVSTTTYTVTATDGGGCTGTASTQVTVNLLPVGIMSNDTTICEGNSVSLFSLDVTDRGYQWSTGDTTADITVTPTDTTTYSLTVTSVAGCVNISDVVVNVVPANIGLVVDSITDVSCSGGNGAIYISAGSAVTMYYLEQGGTVLDSSTSGTFTGLDAGAYDVTATNALGCAETLSSITVGGSSTLSVTATTTNPLCFGVATGTINLSGTGTGTLEYSLDGGAFDTTATFGSLVAGNYVVVARDGAGCTDTLDVTITQPDVLLIAISPDSTGIVQGETVGLTAVVSGGTEPYSYAWSPSVFLNCNDCQNVTASPDSTSTFVVQVTDSNGCTNAGDALITVIPSFLIEVPSGFSPNGDGFNDLLRPLSSEAIDYDLKVWNRWGELVYEGATGWDGTYKGEEQPLATYVYMVRYTRLATGEIGQLQGGVTLVR